MNKFTSALLLVASASILLFSIFGRHGYLYLRELDKELVDLKLNNQTLESEISLLKTQIKDLEQNKEMLEKLAREDLGLTKDGEVTYVFADKEKDHD